MKAWTSMGWIFHLAGDAFVANKTSLRIAIKLYNLGVFGCFSFFSYKIRFYKILASEPPVTLIRKCKSYSHHTWTAHIDHSNLFLLLPLNNIWKLHIIQKALPGCEFLLRAYHFIVVQLVLAFRIFFLWFPRSYSPVKENATRFATQRSGSLDDNKDIKKTINLMLSVSNIQICSSLDVVTWRFCSVCLHVKCISETELRIINNPKFWILLLRKF